LDPSKIFGVLALNHIDLHTISQISTWQHRPRAAMLCRQLQRPLQTRAPP
jgi:hypothetical protein